jgi:hypothetical protein
MTAKTGKQDRLARHMHKTIVKTGNYYNNVDISATMSILQQQCRYYNNNVKTGACWIKKDSCRYYYYNNVDTTTAIIDTMSILLQQCRYYYNNVDATTTTMSILQLIFMVCLVPLQQCRYYILRSWTHHDVVRISMNMMQLSSLCVVRCCIYICLICVSC